MNITFIRKKKTETGRQKEDIIEIKTLQPEKNAEQPRSLRKIKNYPFIMYLHSKWVLKNIDNALMLRQIVKIVQLTTGSNYCVRTQKCG